MNTIPKMRTIKEIIKIMKEADPETAMSERAIRSLATSGELPCVRVGSKILISLEAFNRFLNGEPKEPDKEESKRAEIFPVKREWWKQ